MGILTSQELDDYNIRADSHNWQFALKTLVLHAQAYDLEYVFLIPDTFDISNPDNIHRATKWTNVLVDWSGVSPAYCKEWQEFVLFSVADVLM